MNGGTILYIISNTLLAGCGFIGTPQSITDEASREMKADLGYASLIELAEGVLMLSDTHGGISTDSYDNYISPLIAHLSVKEIPGAYSLEVSVTNPTDRFWFFPKHPHYLKHSFVIFDGDGNVVASGPSYSPIGKVRLVDEMFEPVRSGTSVSTGYTIPLDSLLLEGGQTFCARFTSDRLPPSFAEKFRGSGERKAIFLRSNTICFDIIREKGSISIGNIRSSVDVAR